MGDANNDELVSHFMAVTGISDAEKATSYLEMSGGDLETAVGLYMEHEQTAGVVSGTAASGLALQDQIRAPDATRTMRLMDDGPSNPMLGGHTMMGMMGGIDPAIRLMNDMMEEQLAQTAFSAAPRAIDARAAVNAAAAETLDDDGEYVMEDDDDDDVQVLSGPQIPARLSDLFAAPTEILFKNGGFQNARTTAKDSRRWLLVNIQRDAEFASHALNRDVWRDELVENLVREGFIFWQTMDQTAEGRTYTERYQVHDFPHIGIVDPRTGRLLWRKEGWTQANPMTAELFAEMAMDFCSRNSFDRAPQAPRPSGARVPKRPMQQMSEDEQLQAAMRASMGDVVADEDKKEEDGDSDEEIEYIAPDTEESKPAAIKSPPSMSTDLIGMDVGQEPPSGARIQLRMPDGKRVVRKFPGDSLVKIVYAFVAQSNEEARGGREFVLMAGFPPSDLIDECEKTIDECKLAGQAVAVRWKE